MADEKSYLKQVESGKVKTDEEVIEQAEAALRDMEYQGELEERNWDAQEKLYQVVNNNIRVLNPEHEYQKVDEFWELQRELHTIAHERSKIQHDGTMRQIAKAISEREKQLKDLKGE